MLLDGHASENEALPAVEPLSQFPRLGLDLVFQTLCLARAWLLVRFTVKLEMLE